MAIARDWDGKSYDRISGPMERMGLEVLDRLPLRGDETVLDAGCGSGRVTEALLQRLPRGHVIGVDGAPSPRRAGRPRAARAGPDPSRRRRPHRRRGALDRHVPLDPGPPRAVRAP